MMKVASSLQQVSPHGPTFTIATPGAIAPHRAVTVTDLANEFLTAKAKAGRSDNYLKCLRAHLQAFIKDAPERAAWTVTAKEIEAWAHAQGWGPRTIMGHLLTVRTLFTFAVGRAYCVANPALAVDLPTLDNEPPMIHTPEQVRAMLDASLDADPSACRCLAVRYFGGLRTSEAVNLAEEEILHEQGLILVTAAKAKTRKRRLVTIQPALAGWLLATQKRGGTLPLKQSNNRLSWAVQRGGVPWDKSVTRHTFCSYHLAKFRSAANTALEAGHSEIGRASCRERV